MRTFGKETHSALVSLSACLLLSTQAFAQTQNTATGTQVLNSNTTGSYNTGNGYRALYSNTTADGNTATGRQAMYLNTTGAANTATGRNALYSNTLGHYNVATGHHALFLNTTGVQNTAAGSNALYQNTQGSNNVAAGFNALSAHTSGTYNTAVGAFAMQNSTGWSSTAIGALTLSSSTAVNNTAVGYAASYKNINGTANVATGYSALYNNTSGSGNSAFGYYSLQFNVSGDYNTALGNWSGPASGQTNLFNTTALGNAATVTASNQVRIGNSAVTWIGGAANWSATSDARFKVDVRRNVPGLDFIMKLNPVTYRWDMRKLDAFEGNAEPIASDAMTAARDEKEKSHYTGFLAQEVEAAARECDFDFSGVIKPGNEQTAYQLSYAEFVVPLVRAVQEQQRQIDELKGVIARAEGGGNSFAARLGGTADLEHVLLGLGLAASLLLMNKRRRMNAAAQKAPL